MLFLGLPLFFLGLPSLFSREVAEKSRPRLDASAMNGSSGSCMLFLGRPLRFGGIEPFISSKMFECTVASRDLGADRGVAFLTGVALRFDFALAASDFRGLPRRLTGDDASGSFNGTVVVRVTCWTVGELAFSSPRFGSACTVTLMRHGLAPLPRGVFITMDLEGDTISKLPIDCPRFCLLGELDASGCLVVRVAERREGVAFSMSERDSGSGDDSAEYVPKSSSSMAEFARGAMVYWLVVTMGV